jgi:hypothetical protein
MNDVWIQARGFDEIIPVVILILWGVGKLMASRAAAKEKSRPPADVALPPAPGPGIDPVPRKPSREVELRRFLAELTGVEVPQPEPPPPQAYEPPAPMPAPPTPSYPFRAQIDRTPPMDRMARARSEARRKRMRSMQPPPVPAPQFFAPSPAPERVHGVRARDSADMAPAKTRVFHSTAMRDFSIAGPRVDSILRVTRAGSGHATWHIRPLLSDVRRLREAVILQTVLSPPRALDPLG